jgi:hypothetical protein
MLIILILILIFNFLTAWHVHVSDSGSSRLYLRVAIMFETRSNIM